MSDAVDTKVVEMRFNNSDFEKNAKQSMSTLEKLKRSLKLDGASAGLKEVEKASRKLDFRDMNRNVDSVGKRFSVLETIATGALLKIGATAADVGMRMAKSLTIDQVAAGWNKYEQKVSAVQTIMANLSDTEGQFTDSSAKMDYVNGYLEKLMWFSDETSYSFTEMTNNLGKFIAVGQGLDDSVTAIQGISTWAALAGQRSQEAARAMYNISQALGIGAMTTIDWKSIENANMATKEFKETAIETAVAMGKLKDGQVTIENFRDSLQKKWFDKEVMMEVFKTYGSAAERIRKYAEEHNTTVQDAIRAIKIEDAEFADSLGFRAFAAAQEAKTFSEAVEATADAVSTKWLKIFENIFGNYEQAKELWTDFSEGLYEVFAEPLNTLNEVMSLWNRGFLKDGPQNIMDKWFEGGHLDDLDNGLAFITEDAAKMAVANDSATYSILELDDGTKKLMMTMKEEDGLYHQYSKQIYQSDKKLISGRETLLQGFQNIFDTVVHDVYDKNGELESMSFFGAFKRGLLEAIFGTSELGELVPLVSKKLWGLTNRFKELTERMKPSMETSLKIKNAFKGVFTVFKIGGKFVKAVIKPFKDLFSTIFKRKEGSKGLLDLADAMASWIQQLDEFLERNGVFKAVSTAISNGIDKIKTGVNNLSIALTGLSVKDLFSNIKNGIVEFLTKHNLSGVFQSIEAFFSGIISQIKELKEGVLPEKMTGFQKFFIGITGIFSSLKDFFSGLLPSFETIGSKIQAVFAFIGSILSGKGSNNKGGVSKLAPIWDGVKSFFSGIIEFFQEMAPTIKAVGQWLGEAIGTVGKVLGRLFRDHDLVDVIEMIYKGDFLNSLTGLNKELAGSGGGLFKSGSGVLDSIASFIKTITGKEQQRKGILQTIAEDLGAVKDVLKSYQTEIRAQALIDIGVGIGLLVGSMYVLTKIADDRDKLIIAGNALAQIAGAFALLVGVISAISVIKKKLTSGKTGVQSIFTKIGSMFSSVVQSSVFANDSSFKFVKYSLGVLLLATAFAKIAKSLKDFVNGVSDLGKKVSTSEFKDGLTALGLIALALAALQLFGKFGKRTSLSMVVSVLVFVLLIKKLNALAASISDVGKTTNFMNFFHGLTVLGLILGFLAIFNVMSDIGGGTKILSMALSILLVLTLIHSVKTVATALTGLAKETEPDKLKQAGRSVALILGSILLTMVALSALQKFGKKRSSIVSSLSAILFILSAALSIKVIANALIKLSKEDVGKIKKAVDVIKSVALVVGAILAVLSLIGGAKIKIESGPVNGSFNGAKGLVVGALGFVAACAGIYVMALAIEKVASIRLSTEDIERVGSIIRGLTGTVGWTIGLLGAISGLSIGVTAGPVSVGFLGELGVPLGALSFVTVCAGIYVMALAIEKVAAIGLSTEDIERVGSIITGLNRTIGWTVGLLGLLAGLNVGALAGPVLIGFSGTLGAPVGALSFVAACQGVYIMAEALEKVAAIPMSPEELERSAAILESLSRVVRRTVSLLGLLSGFSLGIPLVAGYTGELGVPIGALSFAAACQGIYVIAEALEKVAEIRMSPAEMEQTGEAVESIATVVRKSVAALGALAGLDVDLIGIDYSGEKGIPLAAESFVSACDGIKKISEAASDLASIGENGISDKLVNQIGKLIDTATSVFALKVRDIILPSEDMAKKAEAFASVTDSFKGIFMSIASLSASNDVMNSAVQAVYLADGITKSISDFLKTKISGDINTKVSAFSALTAAFNSLISTIASLDHIEVSEGFSDQLLTGINTLVGNITAEYVAAIQGSSQAVYSAAVSLTTVIREPLTSLNSRSWGQDIGAQLAQGLLDKIPVVRAAADRLADVIHDILGFSEPKEGPLSDFHTYAPDMIKLWNKGIYDNLGSVKGSANSMANTVYDGFSDALTYVSDLIDNGMSDQLTIRPVMDLSEIQNGVNSIDDMMSLRDYSVAARTTRLAAYTASGMTPAVVPAPAESFQTDVGPTNNTFYITSNDPNEVAERVSKILGFQTRRQKAVWDRKK